jgi:hypothetical protein
MTGAWGSERNSHPLQRSYSAHGGMVRWGGGRGLAGAAELLA